MIIPNWLAKSKWLFITFFVAIIAFSLIRYKSLLNNIKKISFRSTAIELYPFIIYTIPCLLSCLILFPREHYFYISNILFLFLLLVLIQFIYSSITKSVHRIHFYEYFVSISMVVYLLFLNRSVTDYYSESHTHIKETVKYIQQMNINYQVNLLENEGGVNVFLTNNFRSLLGWTKNTNFYDYLKQHSINMIWVTDALQYDSRYISDTDWNDFLSNYETFGFAKQQKQGIKGYFLIKNTQ